ncbi:MAG: hypothetical protein RLZZ38_762 [Bacteroidota bacterium]
MILYSDNNFKKGPVTSEARFAFIYSNPITVTDAVSIKSK